MREVGIMLDEKNFCKTGQIEGYLGVVLGLIVIGIGGFFVFTDTTVASSLVGMTYDYTAPPPDLIDVAKDLFPLLGCMALGSLITTAIHYFRNRG